jgi:hypothetical protein
MFKFREIIVFLFYLKPKYEENYKIQNYTKIYQKFSENCQSLLRYLASSEILLNSPRDIQEKLKVLSEIVPK